MANNVTVMLPRGAAVAHHPLDDGRTLALIQRMYAPAATNDEFEVFIGICRSLNLDPRKKQIYHAVYNKDDPAKRKVVIMVGIDGYRSIAYRTGEYIPGEKPPVIETDPTKIDATNPLGIVKAIVTVRKFFHGQILTYEDEAYWDEYAPILETNPDAYDWVDTGEVWPDSGKAKKKKVKREGADTGRALDPKSLWAKMPRNQIAKCAEAKALRKGWPEELSGVYVTEEMDRANAIELAEQAMVEERRALIGGPGIYIQWRDNQPIEHVPLGQVTDRVMAFIEEQEKAEEFSVVAAWASTNAAALREFWSHNKGEALEIRKRLDAVKAKMAEVEQ